MRTHDLKTWPSYFEAVLRGEKRHEIRRNDRDFAVGDMLHLREWRPPEWEPEPVKHFIEGVGEVLCAVPKLVGGYTGRSLRARVTYVSPGGQFGVAADHVVMSIEVTGGYT